MPATTQATTWPPGATHYPTAGDAHVEVVGSTARCTGCPTVAPPGTPPHRWARDHAGQCKEASLHVAFGRYQIRLQAPEAAAYLAAALTMKNHDAGHLADVVSGLAEAPAAQETEQSF